MGFYQPFTIIKDAQRHGLKVLPADVTRSNWECTIESVSGQSSVARGREKDYSLTRGNGDPENFFKPTDRRPLTTNHHLRLGLLCVKGLRAEAGGADLGAPLRPALSCHPHSLSRRPVI